VEVRGLVVIEVHRDHDPVELAESGHDPIVPITWDGAQRWLRRSGRVRRKSGRRMRCSRGSPAVQLRDEERQSADAREATPIASKRASRP
jgi:hypothetical protein